MSNLPITRMTLYKHGVGFFERRGPLSGTETRLTFAVEEMNDLLKSLTVLDLGEGQVLGVDYPTPKSREERLAGTSIRLGDARSLRDLLVDLRGRKVRLWLDQGETLVGTLVGVDELSERQPLADTLVSIVEQGEEKATEVRVVRLGRVEGVGIVDEEAAGDLRFFLETARSQEEFREITIRLTPGEHQLLVSYVAPAPTWRVSYRLVADPQVQEALLLGWGIFDNQLEEDLENISLSLVAGMPISFVYDLYTPFTPERPEVEEEARVAAGPVEFAGSVREQRLAAPAPAAMRRSAVFDEMAMASYEAEARPTREALRKAAPVSTTATELGELFQYQIDTPVSVGRGHSAMVPIIAADLSYRKELLYNGDKLQTHPVATLRMRNETALTLERGPLTVIEGGEYVGEALLSFTARDGELVVPYAVELNVHVRERSGASREIRGVDISGELMVIEEWEVHWQDYQVNNRGPEEVTILLEHPRSAQFELFDTVAPAERTDEFYRFNLSVPSAGEETLRVKSRRLVRRREQLQRQSYRQLADFLRRGLLDQRLHDRLAGLLRLWEGIAQQEQRLQEIEEERQKSYRMQGQIQSNMQTLSSSGREGTLRTRYVNQLEESEEKLRRLAQEEETVEAELKRLREEVDSQIESLS